MDLDKQIHQEVDTIVSFVIQSRQVSEGGAISVFRHVNYLGELMKQSPGLAVFPFLASD